MARTRAAARCRRRRRTAAAAAANDASSSRRSSIYPEMRQTWRYLHPSRSSEPVATIAWSTQTRSLSTDPAAVQILTPAPWPYSGSMFPVRITTKRLVLREYEIADAPTRFEYFSDTEVTRHQTLAVMSTLEGTHRERQWACWKNSWT